MKNKLHELLDQNKGNITEEVIKEAMSYDNPKSFFEDLLNYGCQSGMICSLIYYKDTHEFFDKHYDEIEEIRGELADQGIEINIPSHSDLKNFLSWLSFEERARGIYDDLGLGR